MVSRSFTVAAYKSETTMTSMKIILKNGPSWDAVTIFLLLRKLTDIGC